MSLPPQHRLRHRRDFSTVYKKGLRYSSRHLALRALRVNAGASKGSTAEQHSTASGSQSLYDPHRHGVAQSSPVTTVPTKIGISISQKVSKKAVIRNRIKRQIKAAIRNLLPRMSDGWFLVIVVRPSAIECDYWQFLRELEEVLITTEVIDGHS